MKIATTILLLGFLFTVEFLTACTSNPADNSNGVSSNQTLNQNSNSGENANLTKDNAEILQTIIKLPFEPEETVWREVPAKIQNPEAVNSPTNNKKLIAVLRFSPEDAGKTASQAETYKPPVPAQIQTEDWFPPELVAQSELSGDETLKGTSYAVNDFIQPPYTDGQIVRIENSNYFILELSAK
ncbi:MAG TPA: hypothetical protein VF556_15970 [Pyrinomonadaceae bacterium]|jgi:hypothetical protein